MLADPDITEEDGNLVLSGKAERGLKAFARIYAGWGVPMEYYRQEIWRQSSRDGVPFSSREDFVARYTWLLKVIFIISLSFRVPY